MGKQIKLTVEVAKSKIEYYKRCIDVLENHCEIHSSDTNEEIVFKLYAKHQSINAMSSEITSYIGYHESSTITNILQKGTINDKELEWFVKNIQHLNHKSTNKRF